MAKFAIVFLAALAFQATSAGVYRYQEYPENTLGQHEYGLRYHGYPTGKFDALFGELQTVSHELTAFIQKALPNDRLVLKTLIWQSRELALYIDTIIEKLQAETYQNDGHVSIVLEQFISELSDIKTQYHKVASYTTDAYAVGQIKNQFSMTVQRTVAQLEKLVRFVQTNIEETHGDLYVIVKNVVTDFLYAYRTIYSHVQYYGDYSEQSPRQLVLQIEEVTKYLSGFFQGVTHFDAHRIHAVREYVEHVEAIFQRIQEVEGTYGNLEIDAVFQQAYSKIHRVHASLFQIVDAEYNENVDAIRIQLIEELMFVAQAFEQVIQYVHVEDYQSFFYEILGDYLYGIQQFRMQMQSGYQTYDNQRGFYINNQFPAFTDKYGYKGSYQHAGLYDKTGYQGLYRYGGYGFSGDDDFGGKYHGQQVYETPKELVNQIQYVSRDLSTAFQNGRVFNQQQAQYLSVQSRHLAQIIKNVVDQLEYYSHVDAAIPLIIYKLREAQHSFQELAAYNEFTSVPEIRIQFDNYVQIAVAQIERLLLIGRDETFGNCYYVIKDALHFIKNGLHEIHRKFQQVSETGSVRGYDFAGRYGSGFARYGFNKKGQEEYVFAKYGIDKDGQEYGFVKFGFGKYQPEHEEEYSYNKKSRTDQQKKDDQNQDDYQNEAYAIRAY